MKSDELQSFLQRHRLSQADLAVCMGVTKPAVTHWVTGYRGISEPYARLIRLFDRNPKLMTDFKDMATPQHK